MPHVHTYLHPRYANVAFSTIAQIYPSVCTNLHMSKFGTNPFCRPLLVTALPTPRHFYGPVYILTHLRALSLVKM